MSKEERPKRQGKIDTRLVDTGIYSTFEQHFVTDDGIDIPVGKIPIQSHKLVRKGEVLDYIAGEVQAAGDNGSEFKGEAQEAAKMLQKLKTALSESDVENA